MGMFKQLKDAKKMVEAAPGLVDQSMQMAAQAQQMAAAQQQAAQQQMQQAAAGAPAAAGGADLDPIAGVTLEQFAEVSKGLAAYNYDQSKAVEIAASKGISPDSWQQAVDGWNARITANPSVAQAFNQHYRAI